MYEEVAISYHFMLLKVVRTIAPKNRRIQDGRVFCKKSIYIKRARCGCTLACLIAIAKSNILGPPDSIYPQCDFPTSSPVGY